MLANQPMRLLIVGPLPPPINGTGVSFQLFCHELARHPALHDVTIIDSSPGHLKERNNMFALADYAQSLRILTRFCLNVWRSDRVLIFGSTGFLLLMVPLLLAIAKVARKPCYVRAFGGSLDRFSNELPPLLRRFLLFTLRRADGLMVQTKWLYDHFRPLIGHTVYLVPGYRAVDGIADLAPKPPTQPDQPLRLVFVGIVKAEKGIFTLLESLRQLHDEGNRTVQCDIFGPRSASSTARFEEEIGQMHNAAYKGVLYPDAVIATLREYDALVLPTTYEGEGHPGVLIEAMLAGIPVISTAFRAIPELIEDGQNGLLVVPDSVASLADAMRTLDGDRQLLTEMGRKNWAQRTHYDVRRVIPLLLHPLGLELQPDLQSELPREAAGSTRQGTNSRLKAKVA